MIAALQGNDWRHLVARAGLPILVEYARTRDPITYQEWDDELARRKLSPSKAPLYIVYRFPAGVVGDACEELARAGKIDVPPLNLLVVGKTSGLPGGGADGYIERYCRRQLGREIAAAELSDADKRAIIVQIHKRIFDFDRWPDVLRIFGLKPLPALPEKPRREPNPKGWYFGPESEEHKQLKRFVSLHPEAIGLGDVAPGREECRLWSGDKMDVYFANANTGVEIKPSKAEFDEQLRGLFQCIKYREILRAQQIYRRKIPNAECVLAIGSALSDELRKTAKLFSIRVIENLAARRRATEPWRS